MFSPGMKRTRRVEKNLVGMLTAAYDARMDGRKAFLSARGLVSSVVDRTDFDGKWRDRLAQEGLSYFRMADFSHSVGDFEPLGKQKEGKRGLLVDLLRIISRNEGVSFMGHRSPWNSLLLRTHRVRALLIQLRNLDNDLGLHLQVCGSLSFDTRPRGRDLANAFLHFIRYVRSPYERQHVDGTAKLPRLDECQDLILSKPFNVHHCPLALPLWPKSIGR